MLYRCQGTNVRRPPPRSLQASPVTRVVAQRVPPHAPHSPRKEPLARVKVEALPREMGKLFLSAAKDELTSKPEFISQGRNFPNDQIN